jgi:hypothetical protein
MLLDTADDTIPPDAPGAEAKLFAVFTGMSAAEWKIRDLIFAGAWRLR